MSLFYIPEKHIMPLLIGFRPVDLVKKRCTALIDDDCNKSTSNLQSRSSRLQYFPCNVGTGFGIGQCVVMVLHSVSTGSSHGVQLVIFQAREQTA